MFPVTVISPLAKAALRLYQLTYGSTVHTFVDIHLETQGSQVSLEVKTERRFWRILIWRMELLLILIPTWLSCVYLLFERTFVESQVPLTFKPGQHLNLVQVTLFAFILVSLSSYFKCCWIIHRYTEAIPGVNYCYKSMLETLSPFVGEREQQILRGFPNSFYKYVTDVTLLGITFTIVCFLIPVSILASLLELDPYRPLMTKYILPHPYYHTFDDIIWSKLVSIVLMSFLLCEVARIFLILLFIFLILVQKYFLCFLTLGLIKTDSANFDLTYYESALILLSILSPFFHIIEVVIFYTVVIDCFTAWVVVVGFHELHEFIVFFSALIFVACVVVVQMCLKWGTNCAIRSEYVIWKKLNGDDCWLSRSSKYIQKRWRAQPIFYIKCGNQFRISNESAMSYMNVVITNVCNAVLLIRPAR